MSVLFSISGQLPLAGIFASFHQSSAAGKFIVILLLAMSAWAWTVIVIKQRSLRMAKSRSEAFLAEYHSALHPAALYTEGKKMIGYSPLHQIYNNACTALGASLEAASENADDLFVGNAIPRIKPSESHINAVRSAADRAVADQALLLEEQMGFLATAASAAPFLGLLGTVWGVMESFGGMTSSGSALLSDVAPGISAALLTTIVGLVVALPSSIGYNVLSDKIRRLTVLMDNFAQELTCDLERMNVSGE